jgi:ribosomal protein S18 acetylase RimI-like enzyme
MALSIRECAPRDADAIGRLAHEFQSFLRTLGDSTAFRWGANEYRRDGFGAERAFEGFVAELDSRLVGFALYHPGYDSAKGERFIYLIDLYVTSSARRSGVGEKLMRRLADEARSRGAESVVWSVAKSNDPAIRFYEAMGAEHLKHLDEQRFMQLTVTAPTPAAR